MIILVLLLVPVDGWCVTTTSRRIVTLWPESSTLTLPTTTRQHFHLLAGKSFTNEESKAKASTHKRESLREKSWEAMYQRLVKFRNDHGHTNVPMSFNDRDDQPHLGKWVATQRYRKKRNDPPYSKIRAEKLDSIGFKWILNERDGLGETWESTYQRLLKYQKEYGHTNVPVSFNDGDEKPHLGRWVATQRSLKKRNDPPYSKIRAEKLDSIGFVWTLTAEDRSQLFTKIRETKFDETWESMYQRLVKYQNEHGHTNVPVSFNYGDDQPHLGKWVATQRSRKKRNDPPYSKIRAEKLDSIGFKWILRKQDGLDETWESTYQRLLKYQKEYGHTNVPISFNDGDEKPHLGKWVATQRSRKKRNDPPYSKIRAEKLDSVGFKWILRKQDGLDETWESTYQRLLKYQKEYGHTNVPISFNDGDEKPHLGKWVSTQRYRKKRQDPPYSKVKAEKLDSIGFKWILNERHGLGETWESTYQRLLKYRKEYGHTNVPISFNDGDEKPHLGKWVATQRYRKKRNDPPYSKVKAEKLDSIGFVWTLTTEDRSQLFTKNRETKFDETWESMYQRLVKFRNEHGHTNVPVSFNDRDDQPHLGKWVATQRSRKKRNDPPYSKIRAEKLDSVGFKWILRKQDGLDETWESMYQRLLKYQKEYGHTNVPISFNDGDEKPHLGKWVATQRYRKKRNDPPYSNIRAEKLDSVGFKWILRKQDGLDETWESTYQRLLKYQKEYGHTNVPISFNDGDEKPHLGRWVAKQRYQKKRNDPPYSKIRAEKLDSIGFKWIIMEQDSLDKTWESTYQRLLKYRKEYGHTNVPISFNDGDEKPHLGKWVATQRSRKKRNDPPYSNIRAEKLDAIGFNWILNE